MKYSFLPVFLVFAAGPVLAGEDGELPPLTYEKDIRPILKTHCFHCHGEEEKVQGNLDLRLRRLIVEGGNSGPAMTPGKLEESRLYERMASGEMPPGKVETGELEVEPTSQEIETIARWIEAGAPTARPEPEDVADLPAITEEEREYWSFQPIRRPDLPQVKEPERVRTPIDAFLLEKLDEQGLTFAPEADKRTLIRRAYFDLLGLPPTPQQVEEFLADDAPDAYERLIEQLLNSPRYGERWGRHWLDAAGYADSEGYNEADTERRYAYKYRDYVIRSFNDDKPFDLFIQEQLAGDEMVPRFYEGAEAEELTEEELEKVVATGFLRMGPDGTGTSNDEPELARNEVVAETIKIVSSSLLGMTVGCAQCHDHRFDPILHEDYFRMRAIFEPGYDWKNWRTPQQRLISLMTPEQRRRADEIEEEVAPIQQEFDEKQSEAVEMVFENELKKVPEELRDEARAARETPRDERTPEQKKLLEDYPSVDVHPGRLHLYLSLFEEGREAKEELDEIRGRMSKIRAKKPSGDFIRAFTEVPGQVPTTYVFHRGDHGQPTDPVEPGDLTVLYDDESELLLPSNDPELPTTGRRLAYAKRLTDGNHPLTARVLVNRFWMHHFGRGIVETPGDFGVHGVPPTHPELLDWLADEFMAGGWRLKRLHQLMMTSTAYRQSSQRDSEKDRIDADNALYGRMPLRRLEAEAVRDAVLAANGALDIRMFGRPVQVTQDSEGQMIVDEKGAARRSIYVQSRRSQLLGMLETFDAPVMEPNCEVRSSSTVAPQALMLMNSGFIIEQAEQFAARILRETGDDLAAQARRAWQLAFSTEPEPQELEEMTEFLNRQTNYFSGQSGSEKKKIDEPRRLALSSLCQVLLGTNEFLYVD